MTELSLNCGAATDTGLVRERNEDRYWMDPARGAFLVVDGVGGQAAGERAAEIAVAAIRAGVGGTDHRLSWSVMPLAARAAIGGTDHRPSWSVMPPTAREAIAGTDHRLSWSVMSPAARVREAIAAANNRIYAAARQNPELAGMACVLTLALVEGEQVTVGHVGDSRLYLIGPGAIRKVTSDHSPVGEEEDAGEIGEEEAMGCLASGRGGSYSVTNPSKAGAPVSGPRATASVRYPFRADSL